MPLRILKFVSVIVALAVILMFAGFLTLYSEFNGQHYPAWQIVFKGLTQVIPLMIFAVSTIDYSFSKLLNKKQLLPIKYLAWSSICYAVSFVSFIGIVRFF